MFPPLGSRLTIQNFPPLLCWRKALRLNPAVVLATTRKSQGNDRKGCQTGNEEETTNWLWFLKAQTLIFVFTICRNHNFKFGPHYAKWTLDRHMPSFIAINKVDFVLLVKSTKVKLVWPASLIFTRLK